MKSIFLPRSRIATTRIGFGCAYLTGGFEARSNRSLVHAAFDLGFRHYDVAPPYGIGTAEAILGEALRARRHSVTIATKVGLKRPSLTLRKQAVRFVAQPIRRLAPTVARSLGGRLITASAGARDFSLDAVKLSVFTSLKQLQTDYLDLLLLHEVSREDLNDELLTFLDKERGSGTFLSIGIATKSQKAALIIEDYPKFFDVVQYAWNAHDSMGFSDQTHFHITHRAILEAYRKIRALSLEDPRKAKSLQDEVGFDLGNSENLSKTLLGAAVARNPEGITLAGTRTFKHLRVNASLLDGSQFVEAGERLYQSLNNMVKHEAAQARC
ncbi:D-threo-aldose 1-dehydrogenase [Bradyrhizobium sp. USDA 372]